MIITPKQPRDGKTVSRLGKLVPYMLRGKGAERCTWYVAGNLEGLDRREDAELAIEVMEALQQGNVRAKASKTYHLVISFHPEDRRLARAELEGVVRRAVTAAGLGEHQYSAHDGAVHVVLLAQQFADVVGLERVRVDVDAERMNRVREEAGDHRVMRKRVRSYLSDHVAVSLKRS
jgi:hypothetical protein